jgi:MFS family permease
MKTAKKDSWKLRLYLYRIFASLSFSSPIFVLFLQGNGLSMSQVMALQAIYTLTSVAFLVFAGSIADRFGRRNVMVLSAIVCFFGWVVYSLGHTFLQFAVAEVILGLYLALWESSFSAWLFDTLKEQGKEKEYKRVYGNCFALLFVSVGTAALFGSFLAGHFHNLRLPMIATAIPVGISIFFALSLKEPKYRKEHKPYFDHILQTVKYCWAHRKIRNLIFIGTLVYSVLFSVFFLYQPYYKSAGIPIVLFGVLYFCVELMGATGARLAGKLEGILSEKGLLLFAIFVSAAGLAFMALNPLAGIIATFALSLVFGLLEPAVTDYINQDTESHHRATVIAVYGTVYGITSSIILYATGLIVDHFGMQVALISLGVFVSVSLFFLADLHRNSA